MNIKTQTLVGRKVRLCANKDGFYPVTRACYMLQETAEITAAGSHTRADGTLIEVVTLSFPPIGSDAERKLVVSPEFVKVIS